MSMSRRRREDDISLTKFNIADILLICLMGAWIAYVNRDIRVAGLYMDDLYNWSCYGEWTFLDFVFPTGVSRFRPVFWFISWTELALIGTHMEWIVPINLVIMLITAVYCYVFMKRLSRSRYVSWILAMAIITSRFSYYAVSQLLGTLESFAMLFALMICRELYDYMNGEGDRCFWRALMVYFIVCFTHERYMVLLPMFFYAILMRRSGEASGRIMKAAASAAAFAAVQLIRYLTIGKLMPAGTGGTEVEDTFTWSLAVNSFKDQIKYLFGINAGPEHLNGWPWEQTPGYIRIFVYAFILMIVLIAVISAADMVISRDRRSMADIAADIVFFGGFMIGCMAASSVTIRVEMRWIYVTWAFMCFMLAYMYGCTTHSRAAGTAAGVLLTGAVFAMTVCDMYYRTGYYKIYLFTNQSRYNSLADETYGRYGDELWGKSIYIIGNEFEMSDFTARTFLKTFDPAREAAGTPIIHVDSVNDVPDRDDIIVLTEDKKNNLFVRVSR